MLEAQDRINAVAPLAVGRAGLSRRAAAGWIAMFWTAAVFVSIVSLTLHRDNTSATPSSSELVGVELRSNTRGQLAAEQDPNHIPDDPDDETQFDPDPRIEATPLDDDDDRELQPRDALPTQVQSDAPTVDPIDESKLPRATDFNSDETELTICVEHFYQYKLDPDLVEHLRIARPADIVPVGIWLRQDYDPTAYSTPTVTPLSEADSENLSLGAEVAIQDTQAPIKSLLKQSGCPIVYQARFAPLVFAEIPASLIPSVAARLDVSAIYIDTETELLMMPATRSLLADVAWARGVTGAVHEDQDPIVVAVVEPPADGTGGLAYENPYLKHLPKDKSHVFLPDDPRKPSLHATVVAGLIAARPDFANKEGNDGRFHGVAWGLPSILDACPKTKRTSGLIAAMEWAIAQKAKLLNISWGVRTNGNLDLTAQYVDYTTKHKSVLFVVGAGNLKFADREENQLITTKHVMSPGLAYNALTVGSYRTEPLQGFDTPAKPSNFSSYQDPNGRHKPEVSAPGEVVATPDTYPGTSFWCLGTQETTWINPGGSKSPHRGTSLAAPLVTGAAVLLAAREAELAKRDEIERVLLQQPARMKAILMASAVRPLAEFSPSDKQDRLRGNQTGVGGVVIPPALEVLERNVKTGEKTVPVQHDSIEFKENMFKNGAYYPYKFSVTDIDDLSSQSKRRQVRLCICWHADPADVLKSGVVSKVTEDTLTDKAARFPDMTGWALYPNSGEEIDSFRVKNNTENTITVAAGDLTKITEVGKHYLVAASALDGTNTGLTKTTLTDTDADFGDIDALKGTKLTPDIVHDPEFAFDIVASDKHSVTVASDKNLMGVAGVGDVYAIALKDRYELGTDFDLEIGWWDELRKKFVIEDRSCSGGGGVARNGDNYEIVEFSPRHSGTYEARIYNRKWGTSSTESVGIAWAIAPWCAPDFGDAPNASVLDCSKDYAVPWKFPVTAKAGPFARDVNIVWLSNDVEKSKRPFEKLSVASIEHDAASRLDADGSSNILAGDNELCFNNDSDDGVSIQGSEFGDKKATTVIEFTPDDKAKRNPITIKFTVNTSVALLRRWKLGDIPSNVVINVVIWCDWNMDGRWTEAEKTVWWQGAPGFDCSALFDEPPNDFRRLDKDFRDGKLIKGNTWTAGESRVAVECKFLREQPLDFDGGCGVNEMMVRVLAFEGKTAAGTVAALFNKPVQYGEFEDYVASLRCPHKHGGAPRNPTDLTGGCCLPDGRCMESSCEDCCAGIGGEFYVDMVCSSGSCCLPDGSCMTSSRDCCEGADGGFTEGGSCEPAGACKIGRDCIDTTEECCLSAGGVFKADESCDPAGCKILDAGQLGLGAEDWTDDNPLGRLNQHRGRDDGLRDDAWTVSIDNQRTLSVIGSADPDSIRFLLNADDPTMLDVFVPFDAEEPGWSFALGDFDRLSLNSDAGDDLVVFDDANGEIGAVIPLALDVGDGADVLIGATGSLSLEEVLYLIGSLQDARILTEKAERLALIAGAARDPDSNSADLLSTIAGLVTRANDELVEPAGNLGPQFLDRLVTPAAQRVAEARNAVIADAVAHVLKAYHDVIVPAEQIRDDAERDFVTPIYQLVERDAKALRKAVLALRERADSELLKNSEELRRNLEPLAEELIGWLESGECSEGAEPPEDQSWCDPYIEGYALEMESLLDELENTTYDYEVTADNIGGDALEAALDRFDLNAEVFDERVERLDDAIENFEAVLDAFEAAQELYGQTVQTQLENAGDALESTAEQTVGRTGERFEDEAEGLAGAVANELLSAAESMNAEAERILFNARALLERQAGPGGRPVDCAQIVIEHTITGGPGPNILLGTLGNDHIKGLGGIDLVIGGPGDDVLEGGDGFDVLVGGAGTNRLEGGEGVDLLFGWTGKDCMFGGDAIDLLVGFAGDDEIYGDERIDIILAGDGADYVEGGDGIDVILGQGGADILHGNRCIDVIFGGADDDEIYGEEGQEFKLGSVRIDLGDVLFGGDGDDVIHGDDDQDTGSGIDVIFGGDGNDELFGADGGDFSVGSKFELKLGNLIFGRGGDDLIVSKAGIDVLFGGVGDDQITSGAGAELKLGKDKFSIALGDLLFGREGNDTLHGDEPTAIEGDIDLLFGGSGNDALFGYGGGILKTGSFEVRLGNFCFAGRGDDRIVCGAGIDAAFGGAGKDEIALGAGNKFELSGGTSFVIGDFAFGQSEDDVIHGDTPRFADRSDEDGIDFLFGAGGDDDLFGGSGAEVLINNAAGFTMGDFIFASDGNDLLLGDYRSRLPSDDRPKGIDFLFGGPGDDTIDGGPGSRILVITPGFALELEFGNLMIGAAGDDRLAGGDGMDLAFGGTGDDTIEVYDGIDLATGGSGVDAISGDTGGEIKGLVGGALVVIPLGNLFFGGEDRDSIQSGGEWELFQIDLLVGGKCNDEIHSGGGFLDLVIGGRNHDKLYGDSGIDLLIGGRGRDELFGGEGVLKLAFGGKEADQLFGSSDALSVDLLFGGRGRDVVSGDGGTLDVVFGGKDPDALIGGRAGVVIQFGGQGGDHIAADATAFDLTFGGAGPDLINISGLVGIHFGGANNDRLNGGGGLDILFGGAGDDDIDGGSGDVVDVLFGGRGRDVLDGADGFDVLFGGRDSDTLRTGAGTGVGFGGSGDDVIAGAGAVDLLFGGEGSDWLYGFESLDILFGGSGSDTVLCGSGSDIAFGSRENDQIDGGADGDRDFLFGGRGADRVFANGGSDVNLGGADSDDVRGNDDGSKDYLLGNSGDDSLFGCGSDRLWGGRGIDSKSGCDSIAFGDAACGVLGGEKLVDRDNDQVVDDLLPGITVFLDSYPDGLLNAWERRRITSLDDPDTLDDETGRFRFTDVASGQHLLREMISVGYSQLPPIDYSISVGFMQERGGLNFSNEDLCRVTADRAGCDPDGCPDGSPCVPTRYAFVYRCNVSGDLCSDLNDCDCGEDCIGAWEVIECDCISSDECRVVLNSNNEPECQGGCDEGSSCHLITDGFQYKCTCGTWCCLTYTGVVDSVSDCGWPTYYPPFERINVGDSWALTLCYDRMADDLCTSDSSSGCFENILGYSLSIGTQSITRNDGGPFGRITVVNDNPGDSLNIELNLASGDILSVSLYDWSGAAFDLDALPGCGTLDLSHFAETHVLMKHASTDCSAFLAIASGDCVCEPLPLDCNDNDAPDHQDIATGRSADTNRNWVPDECEAIECCFTTSGHIVELPDENYCYDTGEFRKPFDDIAVGDAWSLTYCLPPSVNDECPKNDVGCFPISSYTLTIGPDSIQQSTGVIGTVIVESPPPPGVDRYQILIVLPSGDEWTLELEDSTGTAWDNDHLKLCELHLGAFDTTRATLKAHEDRQCFATGSVDALECRCTGDDDCNRNGIADETDIADGFSLDCNSDRVPDECQDVGAGPVIFVDTHATGAGTGVDWESACVDLQTALHVADCYETILEVWVASGVYTPGGGSSNRSSSFEFFGEVAVYGGFGRGETERDQRNPFEHTTVLSGDLSSNDEADFTNYAENSYHVLVFQAAGLLDGFIIEAGNADGTGDPEYTDAGGGVRIADGASPTIRNCTFRSNRGKFGGAVELFRAGGAFKNCRFEGNVAFESEGGGVSCNRSSPTFRDCVFARNRAAQLGGGLRNTSAAPSLINCRFEDNAAGTSGGGASNIRSDATYVNCVFAGNRSVNNGAAANGQVSGNVTFINSLMAGNAAGGIGGAIRNDGPTLTVTNGTIIDNRAATGGGLALRTGSADVSSTIVYYNEDADGMDESAQIDKGAGSLMLNYCDVQGLTGGLGGTGNVGDDPAFVADGTWNDNGTPDDPGDDFYTLGDARLVRGSPCVDAADNEALPSDSFDVDGDNDVTEPLPFDVGGDRRQIDDLDAPNTGNGSPPIVDIGAYERQRSSRRPADMNCDNGVDFDDIDPFITALIDRADYESRYPDCEYFSGDVNGDGSVDFADIDPFIECLINGGCP